MIFCVLLFLALGCSSSNTSSNVTTGGSGDDMRNRPVKEQIVFLDTNKLPKSDDTAVKRVAYLLDFLAENTTSSRKEIGDLAAGTVQIIKNRYGKEYKHVGMFPSSVI